MNKIYTKHDKTIEYEIKYKSIKYTYFRIRDNHLVITTSPRTTKEQIHAFIDKKFDTLYEHIDHLKHLNHDDEIRLWGITYQLVIQKGRFHYELDEKCLYVSSMSQDISSIKKRIYLYELEDQLEKIKEEIDANIANVGISPVPYRLKYLKSKFGSYHRRHHEITLNTYLATLKPIYLKYVIYHEYAHVLVFNHSKDFYARLSELMLNHRVYQKDLKKIAIP